MAQEPGTRPNFSPEEAVRIATERFSIPVTAAEELPSDRDQNFLLREESSDRRFVLRLAQTEELREVLDFQNRTLEHLGRGGFSVSRIHHAADGSEIQEVQGAQGETHLTRVLTWLPGVPLWKVNPQTPELFRSLGSFLGGMDRALEDFSHPAQNRFLKWDLKAAGRVVRSHLQFVDDLRNRDLLEEMASRFLERLVPLVPELRLSVIHGNANDHNVLVDPGGVGVPPQERRVVGLLDFGDSVRGYTAGEAAIAAAYAMMGRQDPFTVASHVVAGYHNAFPLKEAEVEALFPLMGLRLCASVAISAHQKQLEPENGYLTVSEAPAWALLERMAGESPELPLYMFRHVCGWEAVPGARAVVSWLTANGRGSAPVIGRLPEPDPGSGPGTVSDGAWHHADPVNLSSAPIHVFDFSVDSAEFGIAPEAEDARGWTDAVFRKMKAVSAEVGVGRYDEVRQWYTSDIFRAQGDGPPEWRTVHLGIDLFVDPGSPVYAPFDAVVHSLQDNQGSLDYGPAVILEHRVEAGPSGHGSAQGAEALSSRGGTLGRVLRFWTLYGHLAEDVLADLTPGRHIRKGTPFARVGSFPGNGNWAPHLHFQVITDTLGMRGNFPGVGRPSQREIWKALSPDPNLVLGMPDPADGDSSRTRTSLFPENPGPSEPGRPSGVPLSPSRGREKSEILSSRTRYLGPNLSLSYRTPLELVRGHRQFLYDEEGQAFLDCVNNVPNVGHTHPSVVEAGRRQMAILNTNTRYLHDLRAEYSERLLALFPEALCRVYFVNSGSEANELALRLARAHTRREDVLVLEGAYHGNTSAMVDLSPYKFDGPGGEGPRSWVHKVPMPDPYRGRFRARPEGVTYSDSPVMETPGEREPISGGVEPQYVPGETLGHRYADEVRKVLTLMRAEGRAPAAFFCESMLGCGGQIVLPEGYLSEAFEFVRTAGGVCVADEVQVGFGRVGSHFWAFQTQGVVPDIVTLGKPMGNGHPMGAVITTREIADSFVTGMEYFNTYGGNPVSCAIGLAVLDVMEEERLQENARIVGGHLLEKLRRLGDRFPLIGDVRGLGLYIGVELVKDPSTRSPATVEADRLKERLRDHRLLLSTDGPQDNVLKIKPPLVFTRADANRLVETMARILEEDEFRGPGQPSDS
jgi:4-aminobutyrate aminotransferase-like enzyme/Ser/Thr protein kinase RdoA (MazF antagonist)/murein DD-endopeptidase MepM/ murein hydrolase activator NlpD